MIGARGSLTSFTFRLAVVTASEVGGVAAELGVWPGGVGEVWGGTGDPPIKSLTSLSTSSLSLERWLTDLSGVAPRMTSCSSQAGDRVPRIECVVSEPYLFSGCLSFLLLARLSQFVQLLTPPLQLRFSIRHSCLMSSHQNCHMIMG